MEESSGDGVLVNNDGSLLPSVDLKVFETFDSMCLPEELLRGIFAYGYERPSDIQSKAIDPIRQGRDILAQARSGTGKTAAFSIGSLTRVDPKLKAPQVLILVHVRELALQSS